LAREKARKAQSDWEAKEQWYQQQLLAKERAQQEATQRLSQAQELWAKGDIDGALKASLGVDGFEQLQNAWIERKGLAEGKKSDDPRLSEMERKPALYEEQQAECYRPRYLMAARADYSMAIALMVGVAV